MERAQVIGDTFSSTFSCLVAQYKIWRLHRSSREPVEETQLRVDSGADVFLSPVTT